MSVNNSFLLITPVLFAVTAFEITSFSASSRGIAAKRSSIGASVSLSYFLCRIPRSVVDPSAPDRLSTHLFPALGKRYRLLDSHLFQSLDLVEPCSNRILILEDLTGEIVVDHLLLRLLFLAHVRSISVLLMSRLHFELGLLTVLDVSFPFPLYLWSWILTHYLHDQSLICHHFLIRVVKLSLPFLIRS